jgi:hypothetical protein
LLACLKQTGCSETSSQYYATHPEFQEFVKTEENKIRQAVGPMVVQYWAPVLWAAAGQEATVRLSTRFYLNFKLNTQVIAFKQEF